MDWPSSRREVSTASFSPNGAAANGFNGTVHSLLVDGASVYAGGSFRSYRGALDSALRIAKLDATSGALDTTFSPPGATANGVDDDVLALAKVGTALYAGGSFTNYRGGTGNANRIAKLEFDAQFSQPGPSSDFEESASSVAVSGGAVFVGGALLTYRGDPASASFLAKLNPQAAPSICSSLPRVRRSQRRL